MYTLVDQLEILCITNLEWCLQQLAFAVVDVVHCILEQKERLQMLHSFLEIFSKGKNFPVPDTYVKGREFRPKASKARFNIVGRNPPAAATLFFLFYILKKIKISKIYVRFGKFQKYTPFALP